MGSFENVSIRTGIDSPRALMRCLSARSLHPHIISSLNRPRLRREGRDWGEGGGGGELERRPDEIDGFSRRMRLIWKVSASMMIQSIPFFILSRRTVARASICCRLTARDQQPRAKTLQLACVSRQIQSGGQKGKRVTIKCGTKSSIWFRFVFMPDGSV